MTTRAVRPARAALALLLAGLCACATSVKNPKLHDHLVTAKKIGVMPVQSSVTRIVFTGDNESLDDRAEAANKVIAERLLQESKQRGFEVEAVAFDEKFLEENPDLRFQLTQVQQAADSAMTRAYQKSGNDPNEAFVGMRSVLADVDQVATRVGADVLMFARYAAFEKSGGEIAKDVAVSVVILAVSLGNVIYFPPSSGGAVVVCLIDAHTGELLYVNGVGTGGDPGSLATAALGEFKRE